MSPVKFRFNNSNGRIEATDVTSNAILNTSFGAVEVLRVGGTLTVN